MLYMLDMDDKIFDEEYSSDSFTFIIEDFVSQLPYINSLIQHPILQILKNNQVLALSHWTITTVVTIDIFSSPC